MADITIHRRLGTARVLSFERFRRDQRHGDADSARTHESPFGRLRALSDRELSHRRAMLGFLRREGQSR